MNFLSLIDASALSFVTSLASSEEVLIILGFEYTSLSDDLSEILFIKLSGRRYAVCSGRVVTDEPIPAFLPVFVEDSVTNECPASVRL